MNVVACRVQHIAGTESERMKVCSVYRGRYVLIFISEHS